jgi:murein DD-endopeptidase MepM/ murein hydrolase activator NlpD
MRFCSRGSGQWALVAFGASVLCATPAIAEESAPQASFAIAPASVPTAEAGVISAAPGVFIAPEVGSVTFSRAADGTGQRRYAVRSEGSGSTVVSFSATPMRAVTLGAVSAGAAPLARAWLTGRFGEARAAAGGGHRAHAGVDLAAPLGTPVQASRPGRVISAGWSGGYGLLVVVDHGNGLQTRYAHLSRLGVVAGQQIGQGQTVGLVGSTGHSTGPHLHYEMRQDGRPLNPLGR